MVVDGWYWMVCDAPPAGNTSVRLDGFIVPPLVIRVVELAARLFNTVGAVSKVTGTVHWPPVPPVRVTTITSGPWPTWAFELPCANENVTGSLGSTTVIERLPVPAAVPALGAMVST